MLLGPTTAALGPTAQISTRWGQTDSHTTIVLHIVLLHAYDGHLHPDALLLAATLLALSSLATWH